MDEELKKNSEKVGCKELKEIIQKSMVGKRIRISRRKRREEEWYDKECKEKKRKVKKQVRRVKNGKSKGKEYIEKRKEYKNVLKEKKKKWGKEMLERLSRIKKGKEFWKEINKRRKKGKKISERIKKEEWERHFRELLEGENQKRTREWREVKEEKEEEEISEREIEEAIKKGKKKKAPKPDGVPNEAWKYATMEVKKKLGEVINGVWRGEGFPTEWRTGNIIPIYKKGDKEEIKNYRGITLMDTGYKIYAEIIRRRLEAQIEEEGMLEETQQGFRKKREAVKAIYLMKKAIGKEIGREKGKVFAYSLQT